MAMCYYDNQKRKGKKRTRRNVQGHTAPVASQQCHRRHVPRPMPTCIDDNANNSFRVSDGTSSQQQVFFIQPGLFPIVVYAVEEKVACIMWVLMCTPCLKEHYLGEGRPGRWEGEQGTPGVGGLFLWISTIAERALVLTSNWASRSISTAWCLFILSMGFWSSKMDRSVPPVPDTGS